MIKTILVALDGSQRAPAVFAQAVELARSLGARLVLFRALVIPPEFPPAAATHVPDDLPAMMEREARAELLAHSARTADLACELRVEVSAHPWRSILGASDAVDADLIIMGSHGYSGWDRILGTTAGKVTNLALRSVLVVHARPIALPAPEGAPPPPRVP